MSGTIGGECAKGLNSNYKRIINMADVGAELSRIPYASDYDFTYRIVSFEAVYWLKSLAPKPPYTPETESRLSDTDQKAIDRQIEFARKYNPTTINEEEGEHYGKHYAGMFTLEKEVDGLRQKVRDILLYNNGTEVLIDLLQFLKGRTIGKRTQLFAKMTNFNPYLGDYFNIFLSFEGEREYTFDQGVITHGFAE